MRVEQGSGYQDRLAQRLPSERSLVPLEKPAPPATVTNVPEKSTERILPYGRSKGRIDVRDMTPRQMVDLSMDLYVAGVISWNDYDRLAFQPELQPGYDRTIGALIGHKAEPDRPRDFVAEWEERLSFDRKYNADDHKLVSGTFRIINILKRIDSPTNLLA